MAISRSARITLLLVIDVLFFLVELIVGYVVGSLALVADSFHVLNDVMSLTVALYAIKLTGQRPHDSRYSYGWHRAEILAALVNGVFLLALCISIFLEALQRFSNISKISNPHLVVIVGSLGLASNIVGLFLFHEHGHSHGHSHGESGSPCKPSSLPEPTIGLTSGQAPPDHVCSPPDSEAYPSLYDHPAATRASLVQAASDITSVRSPSPIPLHSRLSLETTGRIDGLTEGTAATPHVLGDANKEIPLVCHSDSDLASRSRSNPSSNDRVHKHSHAGAMNMRALMLHVLGDALGNVGVIATGLIIWLTSWSFKYYCDPIISLVITVIIFSSALPLVRSASFILLQGVPSTISLDNVKNSILDVEGVLSLHELHIWQLSETKVIASVHVTASRSHDFMLVAAKIRKALHDHGIHSSTIQPEYHHPRNAPQEGHLKDTSCLILCPSDQVCDPSENACCRA